MNVAFLSIRRPVLAMVISITILIFGAIGFNSLGLREFHPWHASPGLGHRSRL